MDLINLEFWIGIGTAILCGGIVGLERQLRHKVAGIRTNILICLGTYIFIYLGSSGDLVNIDQTRVLGQVVTGVGFLGAGVILAREKRIEGVTSASVIWILASVGALIGYGKFIPAVIVSVFIVAILTGIELLEKTIKKLRDSGE